jgi:hypothetical protein
MSEENDEWIAVKDFKIGPPINKNEKLMIIVSINIHEKKVK